MTEIFGDACKVFYGFRMSLKKMIYALVLDFLLNSSYQDMK